MNLVLNVEKYFLPVGGDEADDANEGQGSTSGTEPVFLWKLSTVNLATEWLSKCRIQPRPPRRRASGSFSAAGRALPAAKLKSWKRVRAKVV